MWDLDTLHYLNELACLGAQKMVNDRIGPTTSSRPAPVFPLSILAFKLIVGPPSLVRLVDLLEDSDSIAYFLELVREYLPTHEGEIMAQGDDAGRLERFHHHFSNQYFPLADDYAAYADFEISDFIRHIPVQLMGFAYDDYEEFNSFRDGFILLLSIVESPFDDNERIPILERVKELVGKRLVELIPTGGWGLDDVHRMFDGTEYEGCVTFVDWVHSATGCWQLDANYYDYGPEEWGREIVSGLTEQWPTVLEMQAKMQHMFEWLEEDMYHNFEKLLAIMLGMEYEEVPKEQIPLPLDDDSQVIREEVLQV